MPRWSKNNLGNKAAKRYHHLMLVYTFYEQLIDYGRHFGSHFGSHFETLMAAEHRAKVAPKVCASNKCWGLFYIIWAILAPFGRFWAPFWAQLGAKGLPKLSFLIPSHTKFSKQDPVIYPSEPFGAIWTILGAISAILGPSWAPRGSQNLFFGTKSHQKFKKWVPEWGITKCMKCWSKFDKKMWDFECAQATELLCIKAFWWLAHFMRKSKI